MSRRRPMLLKEYPPSPATRHLVRVYRVVHFALGAATASAVKVYTPTPEHCLQLFAREPEVAEYPDGRRLRWASVITGAHDLTAQRIVPADFLMVQVAFQPGALYRLNGMPASELLNQYVDADAVLGPGVTRVTEALRNAGGYDAMIGLVDAFVSGLALRRQSSRGLDAGLRVLRDDPSASVERVAASCGISLRQLERACHERTGLGPKSLARLSRFDRAFHGKLQRPDLDWLSVAVACGYYDYQHMARDFRYFAGMSPTRLLETQATSPEQILGVRHGFDLSYSMPVIDLGQADRHG